MNHEHNFEATLFSDTLLVFFCLKTQDKVSRVYKIQMASRKLKVVGTRKIVRGISISIIINIVLHLADC